MPYDLSFRHRQALDPSGLDSIGACLHALQAAAKDCRNAGVLRPHARSDERVTVEVTIGTPVPTPIPTPTGSAT